MQPLWDRESRRKIRARFAKGGFLGTFIYDIHIQLLNAIAGMNGRWGQVVEETACCHLATDKTWKGTLDKLAVWRSAVHNLRMSAVKDVLQLSSCSNLCQPIIHSPHHLLETFRPFLLKATGAAQSDFGLVQLQVDRKLLLNWICLGVQRNRLCHTAGPVQLMQPNFPCGQLSRHVRWRYKYQVGNMGCGHWECLPGCSCGCARFDTIVSHFNLVECCSASWHEAC